MAKRVFTKEHRETIVNYYVNELIPLTKIAKNIFKCDPSTIKKLLETIKIT